MVQRLQRGQWRLRRLDDENQLAHSQGADQGGYWYIIALGLIFFVFATTFRFLAGYNPIPGF
jgi:hypothetical protein